MENKVFPDWFRWDFYGGELYLFLNDAVLVVNQKSYSKKAVQGK